MEDVPARTESGGGRPPFGEPVRPRLRRSARRPITGPIGGRPSAVGDGSSTPPAPLVLGLSIVGLIVIVLVVRPAATVVRHAPGSLARVGSAVVFPVRPLATVLRPKLAGRAFEAAPGRVHAPPRPGTAVRRRAPRHLDLRGLADMGEGLGRTGVRAARLPLRVCAVVGGALRSAVVGIYSRRGEILLYALAAAASAAVGVGVALLLSEN